MSPRLIKQRRIPVEKIEEGIKLCIEHAQSYFIDAEFLLERGSVDHALSLTILGLEELGKSKIIFEKLENALRNNSLEIIFTSQNGFYDHSKKIQAAIPLLDLPMQEKIMQSLMWSRRDRHGRRDPLGYLINGVTRMMINRELNERRGMITTDLRLRGSYVDFDFKKNTWLLGSGIARDQAEKVIASAKEASENMKETLNNFLAEKQLHFPKSLSS